MSENTLREYDPMDSTHRSGFISIVGPANAGKSTLLNALVGEKVSIVSPKEQTTRDRVVGIRTRDEYQMVFVDTPGFMSKRYRGALARQLNESLHEAVKQVDLCVVVIDGKKAVSDSDAIVRLLQSLDGKGIPQPSIVVINKIDLVEKERLLPLLQSLSEAFALRGANPDFVPLSAKTGDGIDELLNTLSNALPLGPAYFPEDLSTDQPERFLVSEIVREKLFLQLNKELPYSVAVAVEDWKESETLLRIKAVIFVERDSQKGIVVGAGGKKIKSVGTSARLEIEQVLGIPVHLELFVKVEPDWSKTERGMRRAGFQTRQI